MLQSEDRLLDGLWLDEAEFPVSWNESALLDVTDELAPVVVGTILDGGWGCRVYKGMVPATKASSWGPAGRTHLVAQRRRGAWAARRLHLSEVAKIFADVRVKVRVGEGELGIADLGNSSPAPLVLPHADELVGFTKPPVAFVPASIDDVIAPDSVAIVRGAMALAHDDFLKLKDKL